MDNKILRPKAGFVSAHLLGSRISPISETEWSELGGAKVDFHQFDQNSYILPLTNSMMTKLKESGNIVNLERINDADKERKDPLFPEVVSEGWSSYNYGGEEGLTIPKKGMTIDLTEDNWHRYNRCIRNYEYNLDAELKNGKVYIGGKPTDKYTFKMDYYFMMGDNRDNSADSRFWGFVPEDHIVGTPMFILISFDNEKSLFNGGIRWNRIFKDANPDKE